MRRTMFLLGLAVMLPVSIAAGQSVGGGLGVGGRYSWVSNLDNDESTNMGGAFARAKLPFIGLEGAIDYRNDDLAGDVDLKTWPVTATVLLSPLPMVYGLAGLGWYHTTLDFPSGSPFEDQTDTKLGYHAGVGVEVPPASPLRFIGEARWLFVDHEFEDIPETIGNVDANSFALSVGVALYSM